MLEEEDALPGAERHSPLRDRDDFAGTREDHAQVRRHVVAAFGRVDEVILILRHETREEFVRIVRSSRRFQMMARRWCAG